MAKIIRFPVPTRNQVEAHLDTIEKNIRHDDPNIQALWRRLVREYFERQIVNSAYSIDVNLSGSFTDAELESNTEAIQKAIREYEKKVLTPVNIEVIQLIREIAILRIGDGDGEE